MFKTRTSKCIYKVVNTIVLFSLLILRTSQASNVSAEEVAQGDILYGVDYASEADAAPVFTDVPYSYWAWEWIETLYWNGVTAGCSTNPPMYCPEDAVTRAQMAVFLERGVHGSDYQPPVVGSSSGFNDVATSYWAAAWIKQLAADGITTGCGGGNYCPEDPVTRAQMAVFLLRAEYGAAYNPPAVGGNTGFNDVSNGYWAAAWIKQLAAEGITTGCGNGNYCPEDPVTRAQMAVFLVRAFYLPTIFHPACGDQNPGDLSEPGNPRNWTQYNALQPQITYDATNFRVFQTEMHNRIVTVAVQKELSLEDEFGIDRWQPEELARFVQKTWGIYWREFGGFPFESYTVVFGKGLSFERGGFGLGFGSSLLNSGWIAHEIYHAWNGNAFRQKNERFWYLEGVTTYYGNRQSTTPFEDSMRTFIGYYLDYYDSGKDRPIGDMSGNDPDYDHQFVAQKGAVIAYLIDLELHKTGHHLGEVSRQLYEKYGILSEGTPSNEEILAVINNVSGSDFTDFFNKYIYGMEKLPVTREQEVIWVCHE